MCHGELGLRPKCGCLRDALLLEGGTTSFHNLVKDNRTGVPRNRHPVGPYNKTISRLPWRPIGGGRFLMSEVPLYDPFSLPRQGQSQDSNSNNGAKSFGGLQVSHFLRFQEDRDHSMTTFAPHKALKLIV